MHALGRTLLLVAVFALGFVLFDLLVHSGERWVEDAVKGGLVGLLFAAKLGFSSMQVFPWRSAFDHGEDADAAE